MKNRLSVKTIILVAVVLAAAVTLGSCAYFNTLYNAKKIYGEAEEMRGDRDGDVDRNLKEKYDEVITKCGKVIRDYPDSKWVDDAIFLMGKCLVRQGEYDKGIRKFLELTTNYPESKYVPQSFYWLAKANFEKEEYNQALLHIDRFLEAFPEDNIRFDVMFLAGDINMALKDYPAALDYYSRVASESGKKEHQAEASLRSAELYYQMSEWASAAEGFESVLGKGMDWGTRYSVSLSLADCYTRTGRCAEALGLCDDLLGEITKTKEKPPIMLGRASSYVCMDSLDLAIRVYKGVAGSFPRSNYSAEAYFQLGVIYHEKLDSLPQAQEAYSKVSNESASSEFAAVSIQRSSSLKRLLELQSSAGDNVGEEGQAEKRFLAAEIQLTKLGETDLALGNYQAVVDSFPGTSYAPQAAYAIGWIYRSDKADTARAVEAFSHLVGEYPVSPQARGALYEISLLGEQALSEQLEAYVDSAVADTASIAERKDEIRAEAAAMAAASLDTTITTPLADSLGTQGDSLATAADSLAAEPAAADSTAADSTGTGRATGVDTTRAPSREQVKKETTYPLEGAADSTKTPKPPHPSGRRENR